MVRHALRSVPEKAVASAHSKARAIRRPRCISGSIDFPTFELTVRFVSHCFNFFFPFEYTFWVFHFAFVSNYLNCLYWIGH